MEGRPALEGPPLPGPGSALGDALRGTKPCWSSTGRGECCAPGALPKRSRGLTPCPSLPDLPQPPPPAESSPSPRIRLRVAS